MHEKYALQSQCIVVLIQCMGGDNMDYSALYHIMFNAATDAVEAVSQGEAEHARELLIAAQQRCEEEYVSDCSEAAASNARARAD